MKGEEKRSVLDVVEIQAVGSARIVEGTEEGPFVREQRTIYIVRGSTMFYIILVK